MEDGELSNTSGTCSNCQLLAQLYGCWYYDLPAPRRRAAVDSFLNSLAEEPATALAAFAAASLGDKSTMVDNVQEM